MYIYTHTHIYISQKWRKKFVSAVTKHSLKTFIRLR